MSVQEDPVQREIHQDWANREYIEVITSSIKKIADFLNSFESQKITKEYCHHLVQHPMTVLCQIRQDLGLTNHVPLLKKSLEQFVYRVKAMLAFNHCQEAFWVGILKNRDLQGEEILSQASEERDSNEEDSTENVAEEPSGTASECSAESSDEGSAE